MAPTHPPRRTPVRELPVVAGMGGVPQTVPFYKWRNEAINAVRRDPLNMEYVPPELQEEDLCLWAVGEDGLTLGFIESPSKNVRLAAIMENGLAASFLVDVTPEESLAAVMQCGMVLGLIIERIMNWSETPATRSHIRLICKAAVHQCPAAAQFVPLAYRPLTPEDALAAVMQNGLTLGRLVKQMMHWPETPENHSHIRRICDAAVHQNPAAGQFVPTAYRSRPE